MNLFRELCVGFLAIFGIITGLIGSVTKDIYYMLSAIIFILLSILIVLWKDD